MRNSRSSVSVLAVTGLLSTGLVLLAPPAMADTNTNSFVFTGSTTQVKTLYNSGLIYVDGCSHGDLAVNPDDPITCFPDDFPGTFWGHLQVDVHTTVVRAAAGDLTMETPDTFRQDATSPFATTFVAKDALGKEVTVRTEPFVSFEAAYDAPLANCAKDHVTLQTLADGINASDPDECINIYVNSGDISLGEFTLLAQDATLPYSGNKTVSQTAESPSIPIIPDLVEVKLAFVTDLVLAATAGFNATRTLAASSDPGTALDSDPISWPTANQQSEDISLPCTVPAGDNLIYKLSDVEWAGNGDVNVSTHPVLEFLTFFDVALPDLASVKIFDNGDLTSTAPPWQATLGEVLAENKPPTVALGTIPTDGTEGTPIALSAVGTGPGGSFDNCDPSGANLDFAWSFDDGGTAFGKNVNHAWADNNGGSPHTGKLVVTDTAGNKTTKNFSVAVANVPPTANAGPDTAAAWGRLVTFNGAGTDPGSADQSTLTYTWDFGDGTPSASGGASTTHAYAAPADPYTATLTVCDKDGQCSSDTRAITVRKRATTATYTGANSGVYDTATGLAATLVDEYGAAVPGRVMAFVVGGENAGTATTSGSGTAAKSWVLGVSPGDGAVSSTFAGDALYDANGAAEAYRIDAKGTSTTYTGAVKSQPNKVVSLSAVLKDAAGKALAGRTIAFKLGTQTASAVTSATGLAATTLKLAQKNASYPLTATYGGEASKYAGSVGATTFKIGN